MTTATINNKKVSLSIFEKAQLLSVFEVPGQAGYTVTSGSQAHKAYHVSEDGSQCNCDSRVLCSHRLAVRNYKESQKPVINLMERHWTGREYEDYERYFNLVGLTKEQRMQADADMRSWYESAC